jgi:hypothetical protein
MESHTPTIIRDAICNGFFTWLEMGRNTNNIPKLPTRSASVTKAFNIQSTNGWHHFVRGRMAIEWGNAINKHLAKQTRHSFNVEHWGVHLLTINWQYILKLWTLRNQEVKGETLERSAYIHRQKMIQEILHIQNTHQHLSYDERSLIARERKTLQIMTTRSLPAYLYGAQMLVKSAKDHIRIMNQEGIQNYFQPRLPLVNKQPNRSLTTNKI